MKLWWIIINVLIWIRFFAGSLPQNHRKKWIPGSSMGEIHNNGWWIWTKTNVKSVAALNVVNIVYGLGKVSSQNFGVTGVLFCGVVSSYLLLSLFKCKSSFGAKSLFNQIFRNQSFLLWNWMAGFHLRLCMIWHSFCCHPVTKTWLCRALLHALVGCECELHYGSWFCLGKQERILKYTTAPSLSVRWKSLPFSREKWF